MIHAALPTIRVFSISLLAAGITACAPQQAPPPEAAAPTLPQSIASTQQVMLGITIPAADVVWNVAATPPTDDVAWTKVRANAVVLAESAVMLLQAPRKADDGDWARYARAMYDAAIEAGEAAAAKNIDRISEAGNALYESCEGCHQKYMPARQGESSSAGS